MFEKSKIQLQTSCISNVPLQIYDNDFTFVVNNKEFKTSKIISDLLSPIICKHHINDPTFNKFVINTKNEGDFSFFLNLINFDSHEIPENENEFISEVNKFLGNESIKIENPLENVQITVDNVFDLLKNHQKYESTFSEEIQNEIDFISSHFYEICENQEGQLKQLSEDTLELILANQQLELIDEEQLLQFVNQLYLKDNRYSYFYSFIDFSNVKSDFINEFLNLFDMNDMTNQIWIAISNRLKTPIYKVKNEDEVNSPSQRYRQGISFDFDEENYFNGILNYFKSKSELSTEFKIECSSNFSDSYGPNNLINFNENKYFCSSGDSNSWISFDFKKHRIIPKYYSIKSGPYPKNAHHPKTWVIEGSVNNEKWFVINEQDCCALLNGKNVVHAFPIKNPNSRKFRYIRMRQTGPNWANGYFLAIDSFEIFGRLI